MNFGEAYKNKTNKKLDDEFQLPEDALREQGINEIRDKR